MYYIAHSNILRRFLYISFINLSLILYLTFSTVIIVLSHHLRNLIYPHPLLSRFITFFIIIVDVRGFLLSLQRPCFGKDTLLHCCMIGLAYLRWSIYCVMALIALLKDVKIVMSMIFSIIMES